MLKPLGDRVVLKIEEKEQTVGGFVLAGSAQEKTKTAQVVATGQGVRTLNGDVLDSFTYDSLGQDSCSCRSVTCDIVGL